MSFTMKVRLWLSLEAFIGLEKMREGEGENILSKECQHITFHKFTGDELEWEWSLVYEKPVDNRPFWESLDYRNPSGGLCS